MWGMIYSSPFTLLGSTLRRREEAAGWAVGTHLQAKDRGVRLAVLMADAISGLPHQAFVPPLAEDLLARDFERLGRLPYKAGLSLQRPQEGWFSLMGSELRAIFPEGTCEEPLQLRKLQELCACTQTWALTSRAPCPGLPCTQPLPGSLNATLAWPEVANLPSRVLPCPWWVGPGVCVQRDSGGSRLRIMNKAWDSLLSTGSSTAIQGDSENQVLVLVERRR